MGLCIARFRAGAGRICAGIKLRESGRNELLIFDRAERVDQDDLSSFGTGRANASGG